MGVTPAFQSVLKITKLNVNMKHLMSHELENVPLHGDTALCLLDSIPALTVTWGM